MAPRSSMPGRNLLPMLVMVILVILPGGGFPLAPNTARGEPVGLGAARGDLVVVYHFHPTIHCNTCLRVQALTAEALQQGFAHQLDSGMLQWRPINVELAENQHFVADYAVRPDEVVVARFRNGKRVAWEKVNGLHGLVHQKPQFISRVRKTVEKMFGQSPEIATGR